MDVRGEDRGLYLPTGRGWQDRIISDAFCNHQPPVAASSWDHTLYQPAERKSSQRGDRVLFRHTPSLTLWIWGIRQNAETPASAVKKIYLSYFFSDGLIFCCFSLLSAKKSHCKPSGRSLNAGIHSFLQGQLSDQSHSSWQHWWGICATLSFPTYKQCPAKGESECNSQACWSQFSHGQNNDRLWVGNVLFLSSDESKVYNLAQLPNLVSVIICSHC